MTIQKVNIIGHGAGFSSEPFYIRRYDRETDPVQDISEDYDKHQIEGRNAWKHTKNLHNHKGRKR